MMGSVVFHRQDSVLAARGAGIRVVAWAKKNIISHLGNGMKWVNQRTIDESFSMSQTVSFKINQLHINGPFAKCEITGG